ncbi:biotin transporter BioY [Anaerosporobacter sp.]
MNMKTKVLTTSALFVALTAICSQIQIPLPMVPINLALFAVYLTGTLLGPQYGSLSILAYIILGGIGIPIFAGFRSGFGTITGPTGGYIVGYIFTAFIVGLITKEFGYTWLKLVIAMVLGLAVCYILGTIWFMYVTSNSLASAMTYCVIPFLPGDVVKIILATLLTIRLKKSLPELMLLT